MKIGRQLSLMGLLVVLAGCPSVSNDNGEILGNTNSNTSTNENDNVAAGADPATVAPGSSFATAPLVAYDAADRIIIERELTAAGQIHVYDLGELQAGDRLDVLGVAVNDSTLDPMIALFDAEGHRIFWNDDIDPATLNFDASFSGSIRQASTAAYLAVTGTIFDSGDPGRQVGRYRLSIQRQRNVDVPVIIGQTIVLHWSIAQDVTVANVAYGDLPAFDAANISSGFDGQSDQIKTLILNGVRKDFAAYDVTIVTSDDPAPTGNYSHIYFGLDSGQNLYGAAEVDYFNGSDMDNGIVFLAAFEGLSSSTEATGRAIANITGREIGRLLGLMPTESASDLMDVLPQPGTDSAATLLDDRTFEEAPLALFPIGTQDAIALLLETVGPAQTE
ncbi:MAG: hypothetical protein HJJLKODD_00015 [Phycisphaerae bacterium]|nr:hypothetical protein [Phycisphaerae bacterium]